MRINNNSATPSRVATLHEEHAHVTFARTHSLRLVYYTLDARTAVSRAEWKRVRFWSILQEDISFLTSTRARPNKYSPFSGSTSNGGK